MDRESSFKNLDSTLEEIVKFHRLLVDSLKFEREILVNSDIPALEENNRLKESMMHKLKALDRDREEFAKSLGKSFRVESAQPRLLELAAAFEKLDKQSLQAAKLRATHSTLDLLITEIRDQNDANARLVDNALRTIDGALGIIRDNVQPKKPTYGQSGEVKKPDSGAGHFVSKQV